MKPLLIVANFKSHMTTKDAGKWLEDFRLVNSNFKDTNKKVILCPPFTLLQMFRDFIERNKLQIELGAQNISSHPQGPYTGEVNGAQIKDFANYVLVGHSERRQFGEDESVVEEKLKMAKDYELTPILFVQDKNYILPQEISICVYEPPSAISTSPNPIIESPEESNFVAGKLKTARFVTVLYGGSVDSSNVRGFTEMNNISGVVVGQASLDAKEFFEIVKSA